ncbi:MAG: helix-turn-helix domain-containing protein [Clostridia bacterium]|nr:helix-turn-helix domain-containing protein [Clostridia bacterium]MDE6355783.1 helix-turn-helix domain-containing protein [Clostridia bacterium]
MENLGAKIKTLRQSAGLTQPQLAEMVGVSKAVISFWENDVNEPKASYVKVLATIFGVSADYILGLED